MKRSRFSEEQIIGILTEHEAGATCADLCRKHGMSEGTFHNWKAKFGGITASDAKRLKALEDENARLKEAGWQINDKRPSQQICYANRLRARVGAKTAYIERGVALGKRVLRKLLCPIQG